MEHNALASLFFFLYIYKITQFTHNDMFLKELNLQKRFHPVWRDLRLQGCKGPTNKQIQGKKQRGEEYFL